MKVNFQMENGMEKEKNIIKMVKSNLMENFQTELKLKEEKNNLFLNNTKN